jgi:aromatic-L-amino-acid decarboxylase
MEETLDPRTAAEWNAFHALAHRMVDDMLYHLSTLREQPAWQPMPAARLPLGYGSTRSTNCR